MFVSMKVSSGSSVCLHESECKVRVMLSGDVQGGQVLSGLLNNTESLMLPYQLITSLFVRRGINNGTHFLVSQ